MSTVSEKHDPSTGVGRGAQVLPRAKGERSASVSNFEGGKTKSLRYHVHSTRL